MSINNIVRLDILIAPFIGKYNITLIDYGFYIYVNETRRYKIIQYLSSETESYIVRTQNLQESGFYRNTTEVDMILTREQLIMFLKGLPHYEL